MSSLKDKRLLFAEDEETLNSQYSKFFSKHFAEVYSAFDGEEALELYYEKDPDVLILDIDMPNMTGLEVVKEIRKSDKDRCILLLTALSDKETLKKSIELNLTTYLEKPLHRDNFAEAMEKVKNYLDLYSTIELWEMDGEKYTWDKNLKELSFKGVVINLTQIETLLLELFVENHGKRKYSYGDLYDEIWSEQCKDYNEGKIKSMLYLLRKKLPKDAIINTYGQGYSLNL
jgi:DNA-binding response OmpR family regulator